MRIRDILNDWKDWFLIQRSFRKVAEMLDEREKERMERINEVVPFTPMSTREFCEKFTFWRTRELLSFDDAIALCKFCAGMGLGMPWETDSA